MDSMASAVIELAEKHLGYFRVKNGQVIAEYCPVCHGNNHDKETFAVGLNNGLWQCLRGSCGKKGNFRQLCEMFGEQAPTGYSLPKVTEQQKKSYTKPSTDILYPMTEDIVTYFATRRIGEQTLLDWKIAADKYGNIIFPFYRDEQLVFVKHRVPKKNADIEADYKKRLDAYNKLSEAEKREKTPPKKMKEWPLPNTEPILFGMDMTTFNKPLVITEGEIDALSLYEAGVSNVVSVPMGCKNLEWINLCWEYLENFNQIILFGDSDEPGLEMVSVLSKRLGEDRCMIPKEYPELKLGDKDYNRICKDANEILICYGPEYLKSMVDSCEPAPIKGVLELSKIPFVDPTTVPRIMTRIPSLDNMIGGLGEGGVTVVSGKRGNGKSTIFGTIGLNAIEQGYSVCAYSGELSGYKFLEWIMLQATERKYIAYKTDVRSGKNIAFVEPEIQKRIKKHLEGKFYLYDNSVVQDEKQTESILKVFEACARRYGCKLYLVDNLMSALCSPDEENKAQARFTAQLKAFAVKYRAHVILAAHPRKEKTDAQFTNDSISGSSAISNLADVVLNIEKEPTKGIRVTKNRDFGTTGFINTCYDPANRRLFQYNTRDHIVYGWDHTGIQLPENAAATLEEFAIDDGTKQQPF